MSPRQFHQISKAFADPQRFAILERLASCRGEVACQQLVGAFAVTPATISHHLKELAFAELIDIRRAGKCAYLTLQRPVLRAYFLEAAARLSVARARVPAVRTRD